MATHSALMNYDIISLILECFNDETREFDTVNQASLAAAARVCVAFHQPAMHQLWRELTSLAPLLNLLPSSLVKVGEGEEKFEGKYETYVSMSTPCMVLYGTNARLRRDILCPENVLRWIASKH